MPRPRTLFDTARRTDMRKEEIKAPPVKEANTEKLETVPSKVEETGTVKKKSSCDICDKEYKSDAALNRHKAQKHE